MNFIQQLSESRMFPSIQALRKLTRHDAGELAFLHLVALRILLAEDSSRDRAMEYVRRTIRHGDFKRWYQDTTDLHLLMHGLLDDDFAFHAGHNDRPGAELIEVPTILRWFRDERSGTIREDYVKRLFLRLDRQFAITNQSMISIRRLAQSWPTIKLHDRQLCVTRLLQFLRSRAQRSEILIMLDQFAHHQKLELAGVYDPEADSGDERSPGLFAKLGSYILGGAIGYNLMREDEELVNEDASAGATAAGDIASVSMPMGASAGSPFGLMMRREPSLFAEPEKPKKKRASSRDK